MISSFIKYFAPSQDTLPALVLQTTCLVDSYMLWIGATDEPEQNASSAVTRGVLCRDWACAMPPKSPTVPPSGTHVFQTSASDVALPIARRLARRFKKQIFLSVDISPSLFVTGQGPQVALEAERRLMETLKELESP